MEIHDYDHQQSLVLCWVQLCELCQSNPFQSILGKIVRKVMECQYLICDKSFMLAGTYLTQIPPLSTLGTGSYNNLAGDVVIVSIKGSTTMV